MLSSLFLRAQRPRVLRAHRTAVTHTCQEVCLCAVGFAQILGQDILQGQGLGEKKQNNTQKKAKAAAAAAVVVCFLFSAHLRRSEEMHPYRGSKRGRDAVKRKQTEMWESEITSKKKKVLVQENLCEDGTKHSVKTETAAKDRESKKE